MILYSIGELAKALEGAGGCVSAAARQLGISRQAVYNRIKTSDRLQDVIWEARERTLDSAEECIRQAIEKGDVPAARFVLQQLGRHRGYGINRMELTGKDGEALELKPIHAPPRPATYEDWARQIGREPVHATAERVDDDSSTQQDAARER